MLYQVNISETYQAIIACLMYGEMILALLHIQYFQIIIQANFDYTIQWRLYDH